MKGAIPDLPMAAWIDEVEAAVDTVILNVPSVQTRLITEILVILIIHIVNNSLPAVKCVCVWERERERERKREREREREWISLMSYMLRDYCSLMTGSPLTTACCQQHLQNQGYRLPLVSASHPSPRYLLWWHQCSQSAWYALQKKANTHTHTHTRLILWAWHHMYVCYVEVGWETTTHFLIAEYLGRMGAWSISPLSQSHHYSSIVCRYACRICTEASFYIIHTQYTSGYVCMCV